MPMPALMARQGNRAQTLAKSLHQAGEGEREQDG